MKESGTGTKVNMMMPAREGTILDAVRSPAEAVVARTYSQQYRERMKKAMVQKYLPPNTV